MSNPSEIFLAPACSADAYGDEGRLWCEDDAWEDYVCECGMGCKTVRYVRAAGVSAPGGREHGTMTRYIISDGTPGNKVVVRDRHAALEIASLVSGFGDTGTATIDEVEDETARGEGGLGSTGTGRAELDRLLGAARKHEMTSHELAEQRASWVRGEKGIND